MRLIFLVGALLLTVSISCDTVEQQEVEEHDESGRAVEDVRPARMDSAQAPSQEAEWTRFSDLPLQSFVPGNLPRFTDRVGYEARDIELSVTGADEGLLYDWESESKTAETLYHSVFLTIWRFASSEEAAEFVQTDLPTRVGALDTDTVYNLPVSMVRYAQGSEARVEVVYQEQVLVLEVSDEIGLSRGSPSVQRIEQGARDVFEYVMERARRELR